MGQMLRQVYYMPASRVKRAEPERLDSLMRCFDQANLGHLRHCHYGKVTVLGDRAAELCKSILVTSFFWPTLMVHQGAHVYWG